MILVDLDIDYVIEQKVAHGISYRHQAMALEIPYKRFAPE